MKKVFAVALILSLMLVGCQNGDITDTTLPTETSAPDTQGGETDNQNLPYKFEREYNIYKETEDYGFTLLKIAGIERSEGVLLRGMNVSFEVSVTNLTDYYIVSHDEHLFAYMQLVCRTYERGTLVDEYFIRDGWYMVSGDVNRKYEIAPGEVGGSTAFKFKIPRHAIPGSYSLICSYGGSKVEFENVFTLAEDVFPLD